MKKVKVIIEEHYTKEIEVSLPDFLSESCDDRMIIANELVKGLYDSGKIKIESNDYNGNTNIMTEDLSTGCSTEWETYNTDKTMERAAKKNKPMEVNTEVMTLTEFIEKAPLEEVERLLKKYNIGFTEPEEDDWDHVIEKIKNDEYEDEDEFDEIGRFCDMYPFPLHDDYSGHSISISDINKPEEDDWDEIIRKIKKY